MGSDYVIEALRGIEAPDAATARGRAVAAARLAYRGGAAASGRSCGRVPFSERRLLNRLARLPLRQPGAATMAIGAIAVAIAVALLVLISSGPGVAPSAAAEALRRAATVAAGRPAQAPPHSGEYVYTKSKEAFLSIHPGADYTPATGWSVLVRKIRKTWIGPDGSWRLREVRGRPRFPSAADRAAWRAAGSPGLGRPGVSDHSYPAGGTRYLDLSRLPTDPVALRRLIEERKVEGAPRGHDQTFAIIGDLLRETYAPPRLRAALYEIASQLPGVKLLGRTRDAAGREGVGVAYPQNGVLHELIFDPKNAALLGEREVLVDPAVAELRSPAGTVIGYNAYLASRVVDSRYPASHPQRSEQSVAIEPKATPAPRASRRRGRK